MVTDEFVFFWSGPFSQWALRDMVIDGMTLNCCEQWMMYSKAKTFGDQWAMDEIMKEKDPREQKKLGRMVKHFDEGAWNFVAKDVVFQGNYAKFTQHPELLKQLADTGDRTIVEASPTDRIWGIGLRSSDPRALNPQQWRGTNWLGQAIQAVREKLREEGRIK